ncbi:MAG: hypothetical protein WCC27_20785 [Acidobacteriaceae bacterium]
MKTLDRIFACLLALGGIGHGLGSYAAYHVEPMTLLWALSASFAGELLAAVNLLRTCRPGDHALAWISFAGCLVWIGFVLCFGHLIHSFLDFRFLINFIVTAVLAIFSVRSALRTA